MSDQVPISYSFSPVAGIYSIDRLIEDLPKTFSVGFSQKIMNVSSEAIDVLQMQKFLNQIVEAGWEVTSNQLRMILGRQKIPNSALGFWFHPVGKFGHQTTWKVGKIDRNYRSDPKTDIYNSLSESEIGRRSNN